jgi:hypothetical protein
MKPYPGQIVQTSNGGWYFCDPVCKGQCNDIFGPYATEEEVIRECTEYNTKLNAIFLKHHPIYNALVAGMKGNRK